MRRLISPIAAAAMLLLLPISAAASAMFGTIQNFGPNLRSDCNSPEGIALDPETGTVFVTSAPIFMPHAAANICVLTSNGELIDDIAVQPGPAGTTNLLGALFVPGSGLYVADAANNKPGGPAITNGRLLRVDPSTHTVTAIAAGFGVPNGLAVDEEGNIYVGDSALGVIDRVDSRGSVTVWSDDPLLKPRGIIAGVNDLAFSRGQRFLYADNTDTGQVLRIPVQEDGSAGAAQVFVDSTTISVLAFDLDGIMFDVKGNLYVCTPFANQVQVISPRGQLVTSLMGTGDNAMHFPSSLVFNGRTLYVSNFSLLDGGMNSKVSSVSVPFPGLPLAEDSS